MRPNHADRGRIVTDPKPRRWSLHMYCRKCKTLEVVRYTAEKRSEDKARQALAAAGWIWIGQDTFPVHATCPPLVN